jgi:TonB family protein
MSTTSWSCARLALAICLALSLVCTTSEALAHDTTAPVLRVRVDPVYPQAALDAGVEGTVVLNVFIDAAGNVQHVHVVSSPGYGLDQAALEAARQFKFKPATDDGEPIASQVLYEQRFIINRTIRGELGAEPPVLSAPPEPHYETVVVGRGPMTSASASEIRDLDFELRPRTSPNDILRVVPGLVTAQHQGGGKADQIFLRGFDADHGTDVAVFVDGVPVNMPTHAHGQGYADLHFLIPEVLQTVEVYKGSYYPQFGDFDTAGAVNLVTRKAFEQSFVSLTGGWFRLDPGHLSRDANTLRFLGVAAPNTDTLHSYVAVEAAHTDGPFTTPENLNRYNVFAKSTYDLSPSTSIGFMATSYASHWTGSGQIPARLVGTPELPTRWDSLDPTEGGSTQRTSATLFLESRPDPLSRLNLRLYTIDYSMALFNDFTFLLNDPALGDEIEQDDARRVSGLDARYELNRRWLGASWKSILGAQVRADAGHLELWDVTSQPDPVTGAFNYRKRLGHHMETGDAAFGSSDANTRLLNSSFYLAEDTFWSPRVRSLVGLRGDYFSYQVQDLDEVLGSGQPRTSGVYQEALLSPKASLVVTPLPARRLDLYLNFGTGFHSNDARLAIRKTDPSVPEDQKIGHVIPRAYEGEIGARARFADRVDVAAALWYIYLQSETVFVGDAGVFEPSDPTRRYGLDVELRARLLPWLYADADLSLAHAQFVVNGGNGGAVALAPRVVYTAGLTARHPRGWKGALRLRGVGDRPIIDPGDAAAFTAAGRPEPRAEGYTILDAFAGYGTRRWEVVAQLENVLDGAWREAQFANRSCSRGENGAPGNPCFVAPGTGTHANPSGILPDVHFTPGNPVNLTVTGKLFF